MAAKIGVLQRLLHVGGGLHRRAPVGGLLVAAIVASCAYGAAAEEEKEVREVDVGISVMLLGSIGFMMALFELTHCPKETMQKNTWKALSATISIFSAVLIFQGFNGLIEAYVLMGRSEEFELLVNAAHAVAWFIVLQLILAILSGVISIPWFDPRIDDLEKMESRLKTFAILLGHITGFAAINAFAELQQQVPRKFYVDLMIAPLAWIVTYVFQRITDAAREFHMMKDGHRDENEELWDDVTEETEDDVVSLATSFCFVQAMRFGIGGFLPNAEGEEPTEVMTQHPRWQCLALVGLGLGLAIIEALRVMYLKTKMFKRVMRQAKNIVGMTFAWCIFFGMDWHLSATLFVTEQGMMKNVVLALSVTIVALIMIFGLMHAEDSEITSKQMDEAIRAVINAIGILIGFAWEKAFDEAVAEITETTSFLPKPVTKLVLALGLAGIVVPAWYRHILPTIIMFEKAEEASEASRSPGHTPLETQHSTSASPQGEGLRRGGSKQFQKGSPKQLQKSGSVLPGGSNKTSPSNRGLSTPLLGGSEAELRSACEEYKRQVAELKSEAVRADTLARKNRELEETLTCISRELHELQGLADQLHSLQP